MSRCCFCCEMIAARTKRSREHLTEREVEKLIEAAKGNRWGHRDATMILIAYDLRWDQVHLTSANLDVRRKNDSPATHPSHWPRITRPEAPKAGAGPIAVRFHLAAW